jgi:galactoside O-acetyltransferase
MFLSYGLSKLLLRENVGRGTKLNIRSVISGRRGYVEIGSKSIIHCAFSFDRSSAKIRIGDNCFIGNSHIVAAQEVNIGNDVVISWGVTIVDHNSHSLDWEIRKRDVSDWHVGSKIWDDVSMAPVIIRDRVWIGFNASILRGVTLGEGAVVGAGSVVTKDVPPYTVVAGNPARVIRQLASYEQ